MNRLKMISGQVVCHTEMQRIDGHSQTPLQLARVDERIDPNFHEDLTIEAESLGSVILYIVYVTSYHVVS